MNWLSNIIRPKISSFVQSKEVPDNLWQKCPSCEGMLFHRDLTANHNVCYHCNHHLRISVNERLELMFDDGKYTKIDAPKVAHDPLKFKDKKRYADRLKDTQAKTGLQDAITIASGTIGGQKTVIAAFNFRFMGGSMGMAVGEGLVKAAETAVSKSAALIVVPASGGARMQEGMLSLVQMPRSIIAVEMVKDARLPYIVLLTDPTTGGVSASFAMVGDIHLAEPGSMIGFAGRRVIEETVRETLPENFQTAEYLLEHGIVDIVVERKDLHDTLAKLLSLMMDTKKSYKKPSTKAEDGTSSKQNKAKTEKPSNKKAEKAVKLEKTASKAQKQAKSATKSASKPKKTTSSDKSGDVQFVEAAE